MATQQGGKGNPASKRMMNPKLKARRARSWERGQERKAQRVEGQLARQRKNEELRSAGMLTPWEIAKVKAEERKALLSA
jgi:hypothetical protein